jgi:hypothetical protein
MRRETNPYAGSRVDHMNARRAAKPASGGRNYARTDRIVNKAAERERFASLSPFDRIREKDYHSFAAIRADAREAFARLRSDYMPGDDIPF